MGILSEHAIDATAAAARRESQEGIARWEAWIRTNLDAGAKNAHAFLKLPEEWRPTTAIDADGVETADPLGHLRSYRDKCHSMWNRECDDDFMFQDEAEDWCRREALPRPTVAEIRDASMTFHKETSWTYDGFRMRHFAMLSNGALGVLSAIIYIMELIGRVPRQSRTLTLPLIGKAKGGHRAVVSFVRTYRLWTRLRRDATQRWQAANDRPYLAAGKWRGPADAVFRQAMKAERAVEEGQHAGTLLWDMKAFSK